MLGPPSQKTNRSIKDISKNDEKYNAENIRASRPVERLVAHFKSWRIFHTDYRRPYDTYRNACDAARALFFFSIT